MTKHPPIVLSVGGSIVVPKTGIDVDYLNAFRELIVDEVREHHRRFIIVVGGGATARQYQNAANAIVHLASEDVDWLGIHATRLNGHLLRALFRDIALHYVVKDPTRTPVWNRPVLVAAGWKPGWSTDYIAVRLAKKYGATEVFNLTNIDRVYDKDPSKYMDAQPLDRMDWKDFRTLVGSKWSPGSNAPFDPIASKLAAQCKMRVVVMNGTRMKSLRDALHGKGIDGTVIA